jgi:hypothetical protein
MTEYYIQTPTGEDGPFSVEELRKKKIKPETLVSDNCTEWMPAGDVESLKSILPLKSPANTKKQERELYSISNDQTKEPATRSKFSFLQWTALILLVTNGLVYYYKQQNSPTERGPKVADTQLEVKKLPAVPISIKHPEKPAPVPSDSTSKVRNNWSNLIKAVPNDFKRYKRGGIHHLAAIVQNKTAFPLDTVKLAVNYIRRGQIFKTEFLTLVNVPEGGEISVPAPDSRAGTAVRLDFKEITSQKMQFFYNAALKTEGSDDPYYKL